jgi:hypothetical protein
LASLFALLLSSPTVAQSLELTAKLVAAMKETSDAVTVLDSMQTAATNALLGKPVSAGSDWSKLAVKLTAAAKDTKSVPLPSEVVVSEPVTAPELANCSTRGDAVGKLNSYLTGLMNARSSGQKSIQSIDDELERVAAAKKALAYLIQVHTKLVQVPLYGNLFVNSWIDLQTSVGESLGDLGTAYNDLRKRFGDNVATLTKQINNLESNISLFTPCVPPGIWSGSGTDSSVTNNFSAQPPFCYQTNQKKNVNVSITIGVGGAVTGGTVTYHSVLSFAPPQACPNNFTMEGDAIYNVKSGSSSGETITATFQKIMFNHPVDAELAVFVGHVTNNRLSGELKFNHYIASYNTVHEVK